MICVTKVSDVNEFVCYCSGSVLVYMIDTTTGSLQLSHKLELTPKHYPGMLIMLPGFQHSDLPPNATFSLTPQRHLVAEWPKRDRAKHIYFSTSQNVAYQ